MDEQQKYEVIKAFVDHPDTGNKDRAALKLGCTKRHINRMIAGYRAEGKAFFVHGNKGRKPATTIADNVRQRILDLYRTKYYEANFEHYTELLDRYEGIHVSASSVMNILETEYILSPKVTKAKKKNAPSLDEDTYTQFAYACKQLGVELEASSVPQAKGRVERLHQTLQSRLPIELRLAGIATIDAANEFLNHYIKEFNEKFALPLHGIRSVFEEQAENEKINLILAVLCERTVDTGHCLRYSNKYYRMLDRKGLQVHYRKGTKVMLIQAFDGNKYCSVNDKDVYVLEEIPEHETKSKDMDIDYTPPKPKKTYIPPMNHPWRRQQFGKFVKQQEHHWQDDKIIPA